MLRCGTILIVVLCLTACQGGMGAASETASAGSRPSQAPPILLNSGPLTVTITSPADETVVDTPQVDVAGQAPANSVITINDIIVVVEASGRFSVSVPLQEGPNELDVIASDPAGDQASSKLVVTYE